jgi:lipid II:glycine glycyltransferase (peptidoglycan interpeptide bridge formation enzyme)
MIIQPTPEQWNAFVASQPHSHLLQTFAWGELKSRFGWSADRIAVTQRSHCRRALVRSDRCH